MSILMPPAAIAARWNGALAARRRRAPLEAFLNSRSLRLAGGGPDQSSDNIATAALAIVTAGIADLAADLPADLRLDEMHHQMLAHATCAVCAGIAKFIEEPTAWRIAALVSAAQSLRPLIGLKAGTYLAAAAAHDYAGLRPTPMSLGIAQAAARAVEVNDDAHFQLSARSIANFTSAARGGHPCERPRSGVKVSDDFDTAHPNVELPLR